ncbi:MAG: hypothetical protein HRT92_08610 [Piscirickettsiaceae bacterium]|nr:hypothetical protein [Piscirickettsiaceae bacterium]
MSLIKGLFFSTLFLGLIGCQTVKLDDIFGGTDKAEPAEKTATTKVEPQAIELPLIETSHQLLSALAIQTHQSFSLNDENKAQKVLEDNYTKQSTKWQVISGELVVVPVRIFEREQGVFCRDYQARLITASKEISVNSVACRQQDGLWILQE